MTFTATVSANAPGSGTPTGSVTFTNGSTTLATVALTNGAATYSTAKLATGQATITATYKGSGSFTTSSASLTQTVNQDVTSATVTSSLNPSVSGQSVTFTVTVGFARQRHADWHGDLLRRLDFARDVHAQQHCECDAQDLGSRGRHTLNHRGLRG